MGFSCLQLEDIRLYLMSRFQQNRNSIMRVESELCPKIYKRLHREKAGSGRWLAYWAFDTKFEVKNGLQSFIVDLAKGVYSYRKWDIIGSLAAMQFHAYSSTESKLRNTLMSATTLAHTKHVMSTSLIHSMMPICGPQLASLLCSLP